MTQFNLANNLKTGQDWFISPTGTGEGLVINAEIAQSILGGARFAVVVPVGSV